MTKIAVLHSAARRLALRETVKSAQLQSHSELLKNTIQWLDPAHAGGTLLGVGGGLVLGDVLRGNKSFLRRLGQATLGAGLGYAGYKLLSDPRLQQTVNSTAQQAYAASRAYIQKLLEKPRMPQS